MHPLLQTIDNAIATITMNRPDKGNAFDEHMIQALLDAVHTAIQREDVRVIVLKGAGKHFSTGADLTWMQRMANASFEENEQDALKLATLLNTLYHAPKPTIAHIQGKSYGGGLGLIAACDIAIAANNASFCFSEVRLGLIPAVISPYVIQAIGERHAKALFMTGRAFSADEATTLHLIHRLVEPESLSAAVTETAQLLATRPQDAVQACKSLVRTVAAQPIDQTLIQRTAKLIAEKRQSNEAKALIKTFLQSH